VKEKSKTIETETELLWHPVLSSFFLLEKSNKGYEGKAS
jgi:hypothetical protein